MYHPENKFIFIHPPKCAGGTIRRIFNEKSKIETEIFKQDIKSGAFYHENRSKDLHVHSGISVMIEYINAKHGKDYFNKPDWFVFSPIRNPFDRVVSFYHHNQTHFHETFNKSFDDWIKKNLEKHFFSVGQSYHSLFHHDGQLMVDDFIRMESLEEDLNRILNKKLGISNFYIRHIKHGTNRIEYDYRKYYTPKTREIVQDVFKWDIKNFGYKY
jgi:hypothetical protein